jgi:exopolyphosphatase/guanosine-5'-triphosphate,3'-diphosphate pyrophosphatase
MDPKRVDMILAGAILLEEGLQGISAKKFTATEYTLRDGILAEQIKVLSPSKGTQVAFHLDDLARQAKRLGAHEGHFEQVRAICERLFDSLAPLHKLKPKWRHYLSAAAILHDTGESVSANQHEQHSYYIVSHSDFPAMETWESELIALLCLNHRGGKIDFSNFKKLNLPKKELRELPQVFLKLLSFLRIADALDRSHRGDAKIVRVRTTPKLVTLDIESKSGLDLELLRIKQKKALFCEVFNRDLVVKEK